MVRKAGHDSFIPDEINKCGIDGTSNAAKGIQNDVERKLGGHSHSPNP